MTSLDAGFLYLERPRVPLHVGCLVRLDGPLSLDALLRHLRSRLPRLRRFAQRAAPAPLSLVHPAWENDRDFDLRDHVQRWQVPDAGGERELGELLETLMARPLERARPMWEAHLLEGRDDDATALLLKVHHCMIDGVSGAALLDVLLEAPPHPPQRVAAAPPEDPPAPAARAAAAAATALVRPARLAVEALGALRRPDALRRSAAALRDARSFARAATLGERQRLPWNAPLGFRRRLSLTRLPLIEARWIRSAYGGTINDVVLSVLAGGLRRYLQATGVPFRDVSLHALVPVSLRAPGEVASLGNRLSALRVPLAVEPESELERLAATSATMERLKARRAFEGLALLLGAIELLPAPLVALVASRISLGAFAHLVATNVPGPRELRYVAGRRVSAIHAIAPVTDGVGLSIAVFSYAGSLHIGLYADADLAPDLDKLRSGIEEAFAALRGSA
jgi:WS/DGAT/MGAT family acyltransferase